MTGGSNERAWHRGPAGVGRILRHPGRLSLFRRLPGGHPVHRLLGGDLFQPQHRRCAAHVRVAAAHPHLPVGGDHHARLVRGAPGRHPGAAPHRAGGAARPGGRQVPRLPRAGGHRAHAHPAPAAECQPDRPARLGPGVRRLPGEPLPGRGLHRHRPVRQRPRQQPDRQPDRDHARLQRALPARLGHPDELLRQPHRGAAQAPRRGLTVRRGHPRGDRPARPGLSAQSDRRVPRPERVHPRAQALGRQPVHPGAPAPGAGHSAAGGQLPGRQPVAGAADQPARRPHRGAHLLDLGRHPRLPGPAAGAALDPRLLLQPDPPAARAPAAAAARPAARVRGGRPRPGAGGDRRPARSARTGAGGGREVLHSAGAVPDRLAPSGGGHQLVLRHPRQVRQRIRDPLLPGPDRGEERHRHPPGRGAAQPGA